MNILELAKECGFKLIEFNGSKHTDITSCTPVFTVELTRFAAAVIEDYKASLVPVAYERKGVMYFEDDISDESLYTKLYDIQLGETK